MSGRDASKDFGQAIDAVLRQVDGHRGSIDDPSQDGLDGVPRNVALLQLLYRDRFTAELTIVVVIRTEYLINGSKEDSSDASAIVFSLAEGDKIVYEDIDVCCILR